MLNSSPSILVVEDDEDVRNIIVEVLHQGGFDVRATASGWVALALMNRRKFDLLVADIRLPDGIDGLEVVRCARSRRPSLRCLFVSGSGRVVMDDPERDDFVSKPFREHELLGCVWELLQRRVSATSRSLESRQAERLLLAAKLNCRRRKLLARRRAARATRT